MEIATTDFAPIEKAMQDVCDCAVNALDRFS
jgi:hypothetical protein